MADGPPYLSTGTVIPPADKPCFLLGNRVDLQCVLHGDPDVRRIHAEDAVAGSSHL
jgi:hypothetical protein